MKAKKKKERERGREKKKITEVVKNRGESEETGKK